MQAQKFMILTIFTHFMNMFRDFLDIFLRKVFKGKIVTGILCLPVYMQSLCHYCLVQQKYHNWGTNGAI